MYESMRSTPCIRVTNNDTKPPATFGPTHNFSNPTVPNHGYKLHMRSIQCYSNSTVVQSETASKMEISALVQ